MFKSIFTYLLIMVSSVLVPSVSLAQDQDFLCFQKERDPRTGKAFADEGEYQFLVQSWNEESPGLPNPFALLKAYSVYKSEMPRAKKMGNDKRMHCYLGCRISQETSYHTADYVGWLKEVRDLSDCNPKTRFEEEDYQATVRGAQFGESQPDADFCHRACQ